MLKVSFSSVNLGSALLEKSESSCCHSISQTGESCLVYSDFRDSCRNIAITLIDPDLANKRRKLVKSPDYDSYELLINQPGV